MKRSIIADVVAIAAIALLITTTFYWIEARREVIILCDNFTPGVSKKSVERQLDTANLLLWDTEFVANGSKIEAYSPLHLGIMKCSVEFNKQDTVVFSIVEWSDSLAASSTFCVLCEPAWCNVYIDATPYSPVR